MSRQGGLSNGEPILGPFGSYFGRSLGDVRANLVSWTVPGSGGRSVQVHRAMLPSLLQVAAGLEAEAAAGRRYDIREVYGFVPRTIGGSHRISRHGLGLAIDINPRQNPFRPDNQLVTDMPQWFVDVWRNAGFCWGGDWERIKDPMHFSWMGPRASGVLLSPLPSRTSKALFSEPSASHATGFAPVVSRYRLNIVDGTGNGAPDVVGLRAHPDGSVIDITQSTGGYGECSVTRWFVPDETVHAAQHVLFGDVDGDSRQDLIALSEEDGSLSATVATRRGEFEDVTVWVTGLDSDAVAIAAADFDGDSRVDLLEATSEGTLRVWSGPAWQNLLHEDPLPGGVPVRISATDRDGDDKPELFALYAGAAGSNVQVLRHESPWTLEESLDIPGGLASIVAMGAEDYDGDGRGDLLTLDAFGQLTVRIGNTPTGVPASRWFLHPEWECDEFDIPLSFVGTFYDDDESIFQANIEAIAASGITLGCNPPFGDRFCPSDPVTRETMAAFLVRALGLTENIHPGFIDVPPASSFAEDVGRLATAGITLGCTPDGAFFCPKDLVTREAMAAFLVRGLGLTENRHPGFNDVPAGNIFAEDIGRLATSGITLGCNATGDDFCPLGAVSREAMAAFMDRAGLTDLP